jgi:nitroreductase
MTGKAASTRYPVNEFARKRWSPRAFLDKSIEIEKLISVLEAARWSPSAGNMQPWRFIVGVRPGETWQKIHDALDPGNQVWNRTVPVLIIAAGLRISSFDGKESPYYSYDTGQSVAYMTLEAMHQGLYMHQMGGFSVETIRNSFSIPMDFVPLTAIALGYIGDPATLPEPLRIRESQNRTRKPLEELVFSDNFGRSSPLIHLPG